MAILTAVLLVSACTFNNAGERHCETYRSANFYGEAYDVGKSTCLATAKFFQNAAANSGRDQRYYCADPKVATKQITADADGIL